jgi:hypothetical protein
MPFSRLCDLRRTPPNPAHRRYALSGMRWSMHVAADARHLVQDRHRRTPDHILALAREVLGTIDLDPATDAEAQTHVRAGQYYFAGGLYVPWHGRVWLNPPGGCLDPVSCDPRKTGISSAAVWWTKLVYEFQSGRVTEALFLAFTLEVLRTGQRYERPPQAFPFCIPRDRLHFPSSSGAKVDAPAAASAIIYLGPNADKFRVLFSKVGYVT